jgi:hypothetical protein
MVTGLEQLEYKNKGDTGLAGSGANGSTGVKERGIQIKVTLVLLELTVQMVHRCNWRYWNTRK